MRKIVVSILTLLLPLGIMAQSATEIVDNFLKKLETQTLSASVSLSLAEANNTPFNISGKVKMRGNRFVLTMPSNEAAYDGKTFYLYTEDTHELSLSTPSEDELREANPMLFAKELRKTATIRLVQTKNADQYLLEFTPKDASLGVQKYTLRLRKLDLLPLEIVVREKQQTTTLKFSSAAYSTTLPLFRIEKEGAFVNDLRDM